MIVAMAAPDLVLLTRSDLERLLTLDASIEAVERAFVELARGKTLPSGVLGVHVQNGGFHIKTAGLATPRQYVAAKMNANFPGNPTSCGLPSIQGVIVLFDGANGAPLAIMDSAEITALRTAAATAVAAKHLARASAAVVTVFGCGIQGRRHLLALARVRRLQRAFALDAHPRRAEEFAYAMSAELGFPVTPAHDMLSAVSGSQIVVTCTPSRTPFLHRDAIAPGTFVAAIGADSEEKQELFPDLFKDTRVVVDSITQASTIGDLHHALEAGMPSSVVYAELAEVVAGLKPGRMSEDEITVFDSTGMGLQDVALAVVAFERATAGGVGTRHSLTA